jgi:hypothetical protein
MSIQPDFPSLTFANGLFIPGEDGDAGLFYYLLDILVTPDANAHVRQHEAAHRLFARPTFGAPDFLVLRKFVGVSHALLTETAKAARVGGYCVSDIRLTKRDSPADSEVAHHLTPHPSIRPSQITAPSTDASPSTPIRWLLNRIAAFEKIIDDIWEELETIAELMAIDFADSVDLQSGAWVLRSQDRPSPVQQRHITARKDKLLHVLYRAWPSHRAQRVDAIWRKYIEISDPNARASLLRLCGSSFGGGPSENNFVLDSLDVLESNIALAKRDPDQAIKLFSDERRRRVEDGLRIVEFITTQMLVSLNGGPVQGVRSLVEILGDLIDKVQTAQDPNRDDYTGLERSWLQVGANSGYIEANAHIVNAAAEISPTLLPRVVVLEILRQALKLGTQMPCQFCGWDLSPETRKVFNSGEGCAIFRGLQEARQWCDIAEPGLSCRHHIVIQCCPARLYGP